MLPQVQEIVPYSASHIWRLERAGEFPQRVRLGGNRVAWLQSEVSAGARARSHHDLIAPSFIIQSKTHGAMTVG
ncbi:AlpA family phage regulatory protein [Ascidiaceihabitans sp.]|nr:AlpA family phage regulatory protein [Ascidiaceihabitans sp.]